MDSDLLGFLLAVLGLILYLIVSAMTEMGTKRPDFWRKHQSRD